MNVQSMDKKSKILTATMELIAVEGANGAAMSQIAKTSGVSIGTIYHYFKSKEEIINEVYYNIKKNFKVIIDHSKSKNLIFKNEFEDVWLGFYNFFANHQTEFKFIQQIDYCPIITTEIHTECDAFLSPVFEFYQKGIEDGIIIDMELALIGSLTYDNIMTLVALKIKGYNLTQTVINQAMEYSWRGIAK